MNKVVNIYPSCPILSTNPPIRSVMNKVLKPVEDIRKCIIARAIVEEILNNGDIIRLDLFNYDKDNNPKEEVKVEVVEQKEEEQQVTEIKNNKSDKKETTTESKSTEQYKYQTYSPKNNKKNKNRNNITEEKTDNNEVVETIDAESL